MRALLADPAACPATPYRRFIRRAQLDGFLADNLVVGEPYLALNAVVLSPADHALLRRLTALFAAAFDRAGRCLAADVPSLVALGFPWVAAELLAAESVRQPIVGRLDFVQDEAGHWWLLEFNADTPSGIRETIVADRLAYQALPTAGLARPSAELETHLVAAIRSAVLAPPGLSAPALGLVTTAAELEDLAQLAFTRQILQEPLGAAGLEVVLGDFDNLALRGDWLTLCGRRIGALYRYVPYEAILGTPQFAAIYAALAADRLVLLNGLYGLLLQHKGLVAWLWEHRDDPLLSPEERAAIQAHLPPTWTIERCPPSVPRRDLVAKQVFGREGEEVFFGDDLDEAAWQSLHRQRTYVVQQRVVVQQFPAVIPTSTGPELRIGGATVGSYAVDGDWAGYYTRFGGKVITSRAKWLATLVKREEAVS